MAFLSFACTPSYQKAPPLKSLLSVLSERPFSAPGTRHGRGGGFPAVGNGNAPFIAFHRPTPPLLFLPISLTFKWKPVIKQVQSQTTGGSGKRRNALLVNVPVSKIFLKYFSRRILKGYIKFCRPKKMTLSFGLFFVLFPFRRRQTAAG